jgi:hypothetical protein
VALDDGGDPLGRNPAQVQEYLTGAAMNAWWCVPIGLAAWCAVSIAVGRWLGPVLARSSQARDALDAQLGRYQLGIRSRPRMGRAPPSGI